MEPGRLIASGRDGDIFEFGPGLVLRRTQGGRSSRARRARWSTRASTATRSRRSTRCAAGGTEIVMERIDGPDDDGRDAAPAVDHAGRYARMLADLHDRLHVIPAPEWLRQVLDGGDRPRPPRPAPDERDHASPIGSGRDRLGRTRRAAIALYRRRRHDRVAHVSARCPGVAVLRNGRATDRARCSRVRSRARTEAASSTHGSSTPPSSKTLDDEHGARRGRGDASDSQHAHARGRRARETRQMKAPG